MLLCQLFQPRIPRVRRNKEEYDRAPRTLGLSKNARALTNPVDVFMPAHKDAQRVCEHFTVTATEGTARYF